MIEPHKPHTSAMDSTDSSGSSRWGIDELVEFVDVVERLREQPLTIGESSLLKTTFRTACTADHRASIDELHAALEPNCEQLPHIYAVLDIERGIQADIDAGKMHPTTLAMRMTPTRRVLDAVIGAGALSLSDPTPYDACDRADDTGEPTVRRVLWALAIASTDSAQAEGWLRGLYASALGATHAPLALTLTEKGSTP